LYGKNSSLIAKTRRVSYHMSWSDARQTIHSQPSPECRCFRKVPRSPGLFILCLFRQIYFLIKRAPPEERATTEEDPYTTKKTGKKNTQVPQIPHPFTSEMYDNIQDRPGAKTSFGSTPTTSNTLEAFLSF
jgi:hypothetical protein